MRDPGRRLGLLSAALLSMAVLAPAPVPAKGRKSPPRPAATPAPRAPQNSCSSCLERGVVLDPIRFAKGFEPDVKASYEAARKYPDMLDRLHCFCECKESAREHHKTLLTCFTNEHAAGCGICQHEALLAARLKDQGASDADVELTVESLHKLDNHAPTFGRGL